jgi:ectoine hydroxylase-related dioxygenase (phytanoyl-CoA dioxygenase family)
VNESIVPEPDVSEDLGFDGLLPQAQPEGAAARYRGMFEGLWTDRIDARSVIERRRRAGQLTDEEVALIEFWIEHGYVVLPSAVAEETCEAIKADLRRAFAEGDERLHVLAPGEHFGRPLTPGSDMKGRRVNDIYVYLDSARDALFADRVVRFLSLIFDAPPLLLQSLTFESGSQQGFHQDTAYVVIDPPLALAASWTALEDIEGGTGELMYFDQSHRLPDHLFSGAYKCWHPERDGAEAHDQYLAGLVTRSEQAGLERKYLLARKGDVLIWSADLAHGGAKVEREGSSRRSLVGHFCPSWAVPRYFDQFPDRSTVVPCRGGFYASTHYAVEKE